VTFEHISVLAQETLQYLNLKPGMIAVDCTVGLGGHSGMMLKAVHPGGRVIGIDQDEEALTIAKSRLRSEVESGAFSPVRGRFSDFARITNDLGVFGQIDAVLADIGVSSMQLDNAERGFSFMGDGPLDMRMDKTRPKSAADLINTLPEADLARIFWEYGEEPKSRSIAAKIVRARAEKPFLRTSELAEFVKRELHYPKPSKKHPATRIFQALRIEVNAELEELKALLEGGFAGLVPGGRLAIITFHSLEDRIVKQTMQSLTAQHLQRKVPKGLPVTESDLNRILNAKGKIVKPFPVVPGDEETKVNPRARSAKLRVIEKI
jgi:16S rRNA (cytosine1402-N4)-methyltransferase